MSLRYEELRTNIYKKQGDIAQILNVKRNTYSKWENVINDMPVDKANILANYYKVSFDYMLGLTDKRKVVNDILDINWELFKKRLLQIRKEKNIPQRDLAKSLGFAQTTYSHFEIGDRKPTTLKVLIISQYYNISIDYLLGRVNDRNIN